MPDQGLDLVTYLAEVDAERERLDMISAALRRRIALSPSEGNGGGSPISVTTSGSTAMREPTVTGRVRSDEFFRMSIPEAIKRFLEIMKQPQPPMAIAAGLKAGGILSEAKNFYTTVWTAIKRLRAAGEIVSTQRGSWGLSDWYPNKPKAGRNEKKPKKGKKRGKGAQTAKKGTQKPKEPTEAAKPAAKQTSAYRTFLAQQMKTGKTMKQANEAWRKQKGEA